MNPSLFSGARGRITYTTPDGSVRALAIALDISVSISDAVQQTFVIGSYNAPALDPTSIDVSVSVSTILPINQPNSDALASDRNSSVALGLEQNIQVVLTSSDVKIDLLDKITDKVIASIRGCRYGGRNMSTGAQSVATMRHQFQGIYDAGYGATENAATKVGYDSSQA